VRLDHLLSKEITCTLQENSQLMHSLLGVR
jgi:hypothetical protein